MDDIMSILVVLLKILIAVTVAVIILTYLFSLITGKRKQTKEEKALADRKLASEKANDEKKLKGEKEKIALSKKTSTRGDKVHSLDGNGSHYSATKHTSSSPTTRNTSTDSGKRKSVDFAERITLTDARREFTNPVIKISKPDDSLKSKTDQQRIRSKKKKVSPRMEVVYVKKNYYDQPESIKVFK